MTDTHLSTGRILDRSPYIRERALFLDRNLFTASPHIHALFNKTAYCHPAQIKNLNLKKIRAHGFDRLVFANPYSSDDKQQLYAKARSENFPILICERGALPGTVALDESGFLADSRLFNKCNIDRIANNTDILSLPKLREKYLTRPALEKQNKTPIDQHHRTSKKSNNLPIVLILLQDSSDTAVRMFMREGKDYQSFLLFAENICKKFKQKCNFFYKPHPREPETQVSGAESVAHIDIVDAIEKADHILCFSSGAGVLAMLLARPVGFYGIPFYQHTKAALSVKNETDFTTLISIQSSEIELAANQFIFYLNNYYSDANFYGMKLNFVAGRDIVCAYRKITLQSSYGDFNQPLNNRFSITTPNGPFHTIMRFVKNKLGLDYYEL